MIENKISDIKIIFKILKYVKNISKQIFIYQNIE